MVDQRVKQTLKVAAGMGKGDDRYVGHLAHGEIILSNAFQKEYPGLIDDLRKAFDRVGINMNRYIVGHKENRINEETGIAEFFEGGDSGGYGDGGGGSSDSGGSSDTGGGRGDGGGDGGGNAPDPTPVPDPTPPPAPPPKPPTPLTPEVTGVPLTYPDIPPSTITPATPSVNLPVVDPSKPTPTNPNGFFYSAGSDNTAPAPSLFKGAGAPGEVTATAAPAGVQMAAPNPIMTAKAVEFAKQGFAEPSGIRGMASPNFDKMFNFADGGVVDAALKKVSSKYSDTGLPLNAMQILSKIARSG